MRYRAKEGVSTISVHQHRMQARDTGKCICLIPHDLSNSFFSRLEGSSKGLSVTHVKHVQILCVISNQGKPTEE